MTAPQLWQPSHSERHRALAELVLRLRDQSCMDFVRIADALNLSGHLSPRGKQFYAALVHSIYRKWTLRRRREARRVTVCLKEVRLMASR